MFDDDDVDCSALDVAVFSPNVILVDVGSAGTS